MVDLKLPVIPDEPPADWAAYWKENAQLMLLPGRLLYPNGPQDYIGLAVCVKATLNFHGAHLPEVRAAIADCFEEYVAVAGEHLKWGANEGDVPRNFRRMKSFRAKLEKMGKNDELGYYCWSGEEPDSTGFYTFNVIGMRAWQVAQHPRWGSNILEFSLPITSLDEQPTLMIQLFLSFCRKLKPFSGYAGFGLNVSVTKGYENQRMEYYLSQQMNGLDVGCVWGELPDGIKTVSWLTVVNQTIRDEFGTLMNWRSELPPLWYAFYDYGAGMVIQAGPRPEVAPVATDPKPPAYVLVNHCLQPYRAPLAKSFHAGGDDMAFDCIATQEWLRRFDVPDEALMQYKTALLYTPKLTPATTLPERL
ncbi:hypothetical protein HNQ59_002011 [Chitinivorax tropicus]|uniref:DUF3396 domain-containing protein n=1 Tax=Chitinivorax tropicus TaxID=714531 RepID=A0A840MJA5_9PROT|nr:type VI immunity family protein [Chitinivorax tropicus]MBB5018718.1 hypothetical protein [Chitinivorax tropicus]